MRARAAAGLALTIAGWASPGIVDAQQRFGGTVHVRVIVVPSVAIPLPASRPGPLLASASTAGPRPPVRIVLSEGGESPVVFVRGERR